MLFCIPVVTASVWVPGMHGVYVFMQSAPVLTSCLQGWAHLWLFYSAVSCGDNLSHSVTARVYKATCSQHRFVHSRDIHIHVLSNHWREGEGWIPPTEWYTAAAFWLQHCSVLPQTVSWLRYFCFRGKCRGWAASDARTLAPDGARRLDAGHQPQPGLRDWRGLRHRRGHGRDLHQSRAQTRDRLRGRERGDLCMLRWKRWRRLWPEVSQKHCVSLFMMAETDWKSSKKSMWLSVYSLSS